MSEPKLSDEAREKLMEIVQWEHDHPGQELTFTTDKTGSFIGGSVNTARSSGSSDIFEVEPSVMKELENAGCFWRPDKSPFPAKVSNKGNDLAEQYRRGIDEPPK